MNGTEGLTGPREKEREQGCTAASEQRWVSPHFVVVAESCTVHVNCTWTSVRQLLYGSCYICMCVSSLVNFHHLNGEYLPFGLIIMFCFFLLTLIHIFSMAMDSSCGTVVSFQSRASNCSVVSPWMKTDSWHIHNIVFRDKRITEV